MGAGLGECNTVPSVRQLAGADGTGVGLGVDWINNQSHRDYGVAAINRFKCGGLGAGLSEGDAVPGVGQLAGADGAGVGLGVNRINGQSHRDDGVATIDCWQGSNLCASLSELDTVPSIRQLAGADRAGV